MDGGSQTAGWSVSHFDHANIGKCYERFRAHDLIVGGRVLCTFGALSAQQLRATPCVRWEPIGEVFQLVNRRDFAEQPRGPGGVNQLSAVHSKHKRGSRQALYLYAKDVEATEQLLARVVLALESIFLAEANCRFIGGDWLLASQNETASERFRLDIELALPILRIEPAADAGSATFTEVPVNP